MKVGPEAVRHFRMSAMEAVIGLRRYLSDHPDSSEEQAIEALRRSDSDYSAADYSAGLELHAIFGGSVDFGNPTQGLSESLSLLIRVHNPWWVRLAPYGRQRLATALSTDELQTFRAAGLMETPPSDEAVIWWDALASEARLIADEQRTAQGRYAETLSLRYEAARLKSLGVEEQPKWVAIDDNSAGYDILSYDPKPHGLSNRLIEVKSTVSDPARLILTRNEWNAAVNFEAAYVFHIWKLPSEDLIVKSVEEMAAHIPADAGQGAWESVEIVL